MNLKNMDKETMVMMYVGMTITFRQLSEERRVDWDNDLADLSNAIDEVFDTFFEIYGYSIDIETM